MFNPNDFFGGDGGWLDGSLYIGSHFSQWFSRGEEGQRELCLYLAKDETEAVLTFSQQVEREAVDFVNGPLNVIRRNKVWRQDKPTAFPGLPEGVNLLFRHEDAEGYTAADFDLSAKTEMPPDPCRIRHDEVMMGIIRASLEAAGMNPSSVTPEVTKNGYWSDPTMSEPWYTFEVNGTRITIGPRKRVINIEATLPKPMPVSAIRDVAMADNVTYAAFGDPSGGYQDKRGLADKIVVHAWGKDKAIEYLTHLLTIAKAG